MFAWVADCLSDPLHTYDLVLPNRQPLEVQAQSGEAKRGKGQGRVRAGAYRHGACRAWAR